MWKQLKNLGKQAFHQFSKWDTLKAERKAVSSVDSRDVKLHYLYNLVKDEPTAENYQAIQDELNHRQKIDSIFNNVFP